MSNLRMYQQMDDTGSRVNGKNHYTHVLYNDLFTAYFTRRNKDRLTLLELLCRDQLKFMLDQSAYALMIEFGLACVEMAGNNKAYATNSSDDA